MTVNLALDVLVGTVPFFGDAFDIAWKANRRNYALLNATSSSHAAITWRDWLFLAVVGVVLLAILAVPILFVTWLLHLAYGVQNPGRSAIRPVISA